MILRGSIDVFLKQNYKNSVQLVLLMENTLVLIDAGFLSKLSRYFGNGSYLKFDIINFSKIISKSENLFCERIFYYTAPPFQGTPPSDEESSRKEKYDEFVKRISEKKIITLREGRVQRIKNNGSFIYKQKGVDSLIVMDLMSVPLKFKTIKKVILIACDSDFVPTIEALREYGIEVILFTYFDKKRGSHFSTSNELMQTVSKYCFIEKSHFKKSLL